jgi:hypothetical protein
MAILAYPKTLFYMRFLFLLAFLSFGIFCMAQSPDLPDYRPKKDNFAKVTDPGIHTDLIYFTLAGLDLRVGRAMAVSLPVTASDGNSITFSDDLVRVTVKAAPFDKAKHKLGYIGYPDKHLVKIDNKPYFGNYGDFPDEAIQSVTLIFGNDTVAVPAAAFSDLYEPLFMYRDGGASKTHDGVYESADKKTVYVYMLNKEGSNYYEVTWVIRDKTYLRRVVDVSI